MNDNFLYENDGDLAEQNLDNFEMMNYQDFEPEIQQNGDLSEGIGSMCDTCNKHTLCGE